LSSDRLANYFTHYLLTYFTEGRPENFFNTNFQITFSYKVNKERLAKLNVLPVTVANATDLKTGLCDLNNDTTACELMLYMFDIDDDA